MVILLLHVKTLTSFTGPDNAMKCFFPVYVERCKNGPLSLLSGVTDFTA